MDTAAAFLAGYSLVLVVVAWGLHGLGRRSRSPWARASHGTESGSRGTGSGPDWPHSEVPKLHAAIASVAAVGAVLLSGVGIIAFGPGKGLIVLGVTSALGVITLLSVSRPLRRERSGRSVLV